MLLIQRLHQRIDQPAQRRVVDLLDDLGAGLLGIVFRDDAAQAEEVHGVGGAELVGGAEDEFELRDGYVDGFEEGGDDEAVVGGAVGDELDGGFEVVEEAVDVGEEDLNGAAGAEEVRDFENGYEVAAVGAAGGGGSWEGEAWLVVLS